MNLNATFIGQGLAFAILIWFSWRFVWPPLMQAIEERQKKIADGLAAAERARKELADADARVAEELKKARVEATQITERAQKQASQIVEQAKQDAQTEAQKLRAAAEAEIANLSQRAKDLLREQVALLAVQGAEKILEREIDATRHRELLERLASEL